MPAGVWNDDGVYVLIGKALAQGDGLRYAGVPGAVPAVKFPPLYPIVLGVLWVLFRTIGAVTLAAVVLNLVLLAAAGVLLALGLTRSAGVERGPAIAIAGLGFASADMWRLGLVPLSEPLFIALMAAAFAGWVWASRPGDRRGAVVLSAILTAALLTRSAGVALVVGFGVALLFARGPRATASVLTAPIAAGLAWGVWAASRSAAIPPGMRDVLGPYGGWLVAQTLGAPGAFFSALPAHVGEIVRLAFTLLLPGLTGPAFVIAAVPLGLLLLAGLVFLHRRFPPVTWVVLAYVAMLFVWPFADRRLVAPIHPLLVIAIGVAALELWRAGARKGMRIAGNALVVLWVGGYSLVSAWRAFDGWAVSPYRLRSGRLATAIETLSRAAPPNAVVGAPEFWAALHLHGGWSVTPSALFVPRSEGGAPVWGRPEEQVTLWWNAGLEYVLLEQGGQIHGDALNLIEDRCPGAVGIVARMPPQMLVHVQWGDACPEALGLDVRRQPK